MVLRSVSSQSVVRAKSNHKPILKQYAVDTYKPAKPDGGISLVNFRSSATPQSRQSYRPAVCQETAWGVKDPPATSTNNDNAHWLSWDTGNLEPPGLQTCLHKPYPSPVPPSNYGQKGFISPKLTRQPASGVQLQRPQSNTSLADPSSYVVKNTNPAAINAKYEPSSPHPQFRSWHTSHCNNYEAEVTYNMLQHLYGGKSSQLNKMRRNRPGRYEHPINFERKVLNGTYTSLERGKDQFKKLYRTDLSNSAAAHSMRTPRPQIDYYPVSYHAPRSAVGRTDHTASSFFQYTQPSVKSSFVIHPQFVSEHCEFSKRLKSTKNLSHLTAAGGDSGLRYGSGRSGV